MKKRVFEKQLARKFEYDVKSVSKQQLFVVCSFGTEVVPDHREEMPFGCGTKWSHAELLLIDGKLK